MNIIIRIKNNLAYSKCRKLRDKAHKEMKKHIYDVDHSEFKKWAQISFENTVKCMKIPLH